MSFKYYIYIILKLYKISINSILKIKIKIKQIKYSLYVFKIIVL